MKNNSGKLLRRFLAVLLSAALISACFISPAAAGVTVIIDNAEKAQYLEQFNSSVNALKTEKPYMQMKETLSVKNKPSVGSENGEEMSEDALKWLRVMLDACFNSNSGVADALITAVSGNEKPNEATEYVYNQKRNNSVPLKRQEIVSTLTSEDYFTLKREDIMGTGLEPELLKTVVRFELMDQKLDDAAASSLPKIFDLPSGRIDPVIVSGKPTGDSTDTPLSEIKFDEFVFKNAYAQVEYDNEGRLLKYTTSIDYSFEVSFYDAMRIITAITGTDLMEIGLAIANPILSFTGNKEVAAKDVLRKSTLYITYNNTVEISHINWDARLFGDVDNNGVISAYDARSALRHTVGLWEIKNQLNQIYTDVNFDGVIDSADARIILRMSVGLEQSFTEPPEGKSIKIAVIEDEEEEPITPEEPENPDEPENPENPDETETPKIDLAGFLGGITQSILGIIDSAQGDTDSIKANIMELVKQIQDTIK